MSHPIPDRALRRTIADLAVLDPEDAAAVLADLAPGEREAIEGLLREYAAYFDGAAKPVTKGGGAYDLSRLSPWLVERLEGAFEMTTPAREALRDSAVRLYPTPTGKAITPRTGLFGRVASIFARSPS